MNKAPSSLRAAQRASLLDVDPGRFRYSAWRNITVGIWANQATVEAAQRVMRVSRSMAKQHLQGHSSIVFVLDGAPAPTPEANEVFAKVYDDKISGLSCLGIVVEGGGFWASRIRSTITGLRMSAPGEMQMRVSDRVEELLEWFVPEHTKRTGMNVTIPELRNVLVTLRELATSDNGEQPALSKRPLQG